MKKLLIVIILFFGLFLGTSNCHVFAEDKSVLIDLISPNQSISVGQSFYTTVSVGTEKPNTTFYYLFYGGPENENSYIQTIGENGSLLSFSDDPFKWNLLPTFTTDELGNGYLKTNKAFVSFFKPPGIFTLFVRFYLPDHSTADEYLSDPRQITVIQSLIPTPTQVLSLTITPTKTPNSSLPPIPTPTSIPLVDMKIFKTFSLATPSSQKSASDSTLISENLNPNFIEAGSNPPEIKISSSSSPKKSTHLLFLSSGLLFLTVPLIFLKINNK